MQLCNVYPRNSPGSVSLKTGRSHQRAPSHSNWASSRIQFNLASYCAIVSPLSPILFPVSLLAFERRNKLVLLQFRPQLNRVARCHHKSGLQLARPLLCFYERVLVCQFVAKNGYSHMLCNIMMQYHVHRFLANLLGSLKLLKLFVHRQRARESKLMSLQRKNP